MPKYYPFKIYGYYLYYTSFCTIEASTRFFGVNFPRKIKKPKNWRKK